MLARLPVLVIACASMFAEDWPQFRGPRGNGISAETGLPITWSESSNIRWKKPIPGSGWSSAAISGNDLFLTTATENNRSLHLLIVDAATGNIRKDVPVFQLDAGVKGHDKNSGASPTPIIEGDRVYVHFGSYGTACVRRDGTVLWRNQELKYEQVHGPGGSPVLYENLLIINCDGNSTQFVAALDKNTGKVVWQTPRPSAMAYATPLAIQTSKGPQVVSPGAHRAVSYDPKTGRELWFVKYGDNFSNVPRPVFANGLVYLCTGFYTPKLLAVKPDGSGDVTSTQLAWQYERGVPLTPSPLVTDGQLYMVSDNGIATALDAASGKEIWRQRMPGNYSASPVFIDGHVYFLSEDGETTVITTGKEFRKVAGNKLDGRFLASISVSGGALFLRSDSHLYRIQTTGK